MTTPSDMLRAASWYTQRLGWHIFPIHNPIFDDSGACTGCSCESYRRSVACKENHPSLYLGPTGKCANPGKCPRVAWSSNSTVSRAQVDRWWGKPWRDINVATGAPLWHSPNIGIDCGKSNLLVFDADTYKQVGDLSDLLTWADRATVTVITQGGGEHLIYDRQGKPYGNATRGLPAGIDIRGVGGYIVAAPSIGKSGRRYQYEDAYRPGATPLLPIPKALDDILSQGHTRHRTHRSGIVLNQSAAVQRSVRMVEQVLGRANLAATISPYGDGMRWVLTECPFQAVDDPHPNDGGAFVVVLEDGRIAAGCHHNRCQKQLEGADVSGWQWLRRLAGMERRRLMVTVRL